jgi:hypothetical protein
MRRCSSMRLVAEVQQVRVSSRRFRVPCGAGVTGTGLSCECGACKRLAYLVHLLTGGCDAAGHSSCKQLQTASQVPTSPVPLAAVVAVVVAAGGLTIISMRSSAAGSSIRVRNSSSSAVQAHSRGMQQQRM